MPIDYALYPPNWKTEIVPRIRLRAGGRCEQCHVPAWAYGWRDVSGQFHPGDPPVLATAGQLFSQDGLQLGPKALKIILTVAHLDHDEHNWQVRDERLMLLCQHCHLSFDRADNLRRRRQNHPAVPPGHPRLELVFPHSLRSTATAAHR
ncbi:hypothetical protein [Hymenobacter psychrotolerans]|uniref:Uncharacterized protein n=1 Tax=Hymenobacter psychrotolerans DSM 18569 TaxID=1121959 RepID=A0A1M6Z9M2_9BACT|nr:hypothetical protein [Hymenobacter psychrotolerans]SHL27069.1 hypothetical protein SAMN02746009_02464 [Hymenobacter psychrotolerans DSM 18569]